jgi:hypothetical protein
MGNIAPPLVVPILGRLKTRNIQGESVQERVQANRMEQAMADDSRLGLVKNQQWIRTNETSKVLVSNYGRNDYQKIEQYPPEVYKTPSFPVQKVDTCPCYPAGTIFWGGSYLGFIGDAIEPPPGWWAFDTVYINNYGDLGDGTYLSSYYMYEVTNGWVFNNEPVGAVNCTLDIRSLNSNLATVVYGKYVNFIVDPPYYELLPAPNIAGPYTNTVVFTLFLTTSGYNLGMVNGGGFDGPWFEAGPSPWDIGESVAGRKCPIVLYCNNVLITPLPVFIS